LVQEVQPIQKPKEVVRIPMNDPLEEAKLRAKSLNIELEFTDHRKANQISFAFLDFSSPDFDRTGHKVPNSFKLSFRFYTCNPVSTQKLVFIEKQDLHRGLVQPTLEATPLTDYALVQETHLDRDHRSIMENMLRWEKDVRPTSDMQEEHTNFIRYLRSEKSPYMSIDIWDGEDKGQYGECRIPLNLFLRQNEPSISVSQKFPIYHPETGNWLGSLTIQLSSKGCRAEENYEFHMIQGGFAGEQ
jgi:hypothetical protein